MLTQIKKRLYPVISQSNMSDFLEIEVNFFVCHARVHRCLGKPSCSESKQASTRFAVSSDPLSKNTQITIFLCQIIMLYVTGLLNT